jgi:hypothetical protein
MPRTKTHLQNPDPIVISASAKPRSNIREICNNVEKIEVASICASMRQAQAAEEANSISQSTAVWNRWGVLAVIATLLASGWAAISASSASKASQRLIDSSERPYLIVEFLSATFCGDQAPIDVLAINYRVKNVGKSIAIIDLYRDELGFHSKMDKDWRRNLGGNNIYFIDSGEYIDRRVDAYIEKEEYIEKIREGETMVWNINFSYFDRFERRRNFHFEQYAQMQPFSGFRSNAAPEVIEVAYDRGRWNRRRNKLRSYWYECKIFISGIPQDHPNPHPQESSAHDVYDRSAGWRRWVRSGFKKPVPR